MELLLNSSLFNFSATCYMNTILSQPTHIIALLCYRDPAKGHDTKNLQGLSNVVFVLASCKFTNHLLRCI